MCDERTSKVIDGLRYTMNMILFNPLTGEVKDTATLNEADKTTYDACLNAVAILTEVSAKAGMLTDAPRAGVLSKISRFFGEWSGDDNANETVNFCAAELREIIAWYSNYNSVRAKLDDYQAFCWPHVLYLEDIETPTFGFIENKGEPDLDPAVIVEITKDRVCMSSPVGDHRFRRSEYGKNWRLWAGTKQPSDSARRQAKWTT